MYATEFKDLQGRDVMHVTTSERDGQDVAYVTNHGDYYELNMRDPYKWTPRGRNVTRKTLSGAQSVLDKHILEIGTETEMIQITV